MIKNIVKYGGLALVLVGIILVMKSLFTSDVEWSSDKTGSKSSKNGVYSVTISLLDKETESFITGSKMLLKDEDGTVVSSWTTDSGVRLVTSLENGTYYLVQEAASEGYHLNSDGVAFTIDGEDQEVVMYNIKLTEEEVQNQGMYNEETGEITSQVGVENTLSMKSWVSLIGAVASIGLGLGLIVKKSKLCFEK